MIILDTTVVSELMRTSPEPAVVAWTATRVFVELYTTTITRAEILYGIAILTAGRRRAALAEGATRMFLRAFTGRILTFDAAAADRYAEIRSTRRRAGRPISPLDAQIAAIAAVAGAAVATRNVRDFEGCGVEIIDPWGAG